MTTDSNCQSSTPADNAAGDRDISPSDLTALLLERESLQGQLAAMKAEKDELARQLATLQNSKSWRLTRSLRVAGKVQRHLHQMVGNGLQAVKSVGRAWVSKAAFRAIFGRTRLLMRSSPRAISNRCVPLGATVRRLTAKPIHVISSARNVLWVMNTFVFPALRAPRVVTPAGPAPQVVMLVYSDLRIDPRVNREARALAAAGFRVKILYPDAMSTPDNQVVLDFGPGVEFRPVPLTAAAYIMRFPHVLGDELLEAVCEEHPFAIHAHDLSMALVGLAAAGRLKVPCICDFHEWYSENVSWDFETSSHIPHPAPVRRVYRWTEQLAMARAAAVVTVCETIAGELETNFASGRRKVHVIRNIPSARRSPTRGYPPIREQLGLPSDKLVVLWQGGTGPTRLLEPVIESLAHYDGFILVIRGPTLDLFGDGYRAIAERLGVADRLLLVPPVPSDDVVEAANGADWGVWTLPNLCKNFNYALPNKIFEYLYAGVPLLVADYPEVRRLVETYKIGLLFDPYDPRSIAAAIRRYREEPGLVEAIRARIPEAVAKLDADKEWGNLVQLYQTLAREGTLKSLPSPLGRY